MPSPTSPELPTSPEPQGDAATLGEHVADDAGPFIPMVPGPWKALDSEESAQFAQQLDRHLKAAGLADPPFSQQCPILSLHAVPLTFYPGWLLVQGECRMNTTQIASFDVLLGPGYIWCLDGSAPMIYALNDGQVPLPATSEGAEPSKLRPELTAPDYLRFFCHGVRSDQGVFRLIEHVGDLEIAGVTRDLDKFRAQLKPLKMSWVRANGETGSAGDDEAASGDAMQAQTTLLHGGILSAVTFEVNKSGLVTMDDEEVIATDLCEPERTQIWLRSIRELQP
jgi:hypothetical protein